MQREGDQFTFDPKVQMLQLLCMPCCTKVVSTGYAMDVEMDKLHNNARVHVRVTLNQE